MAIKKIVGIDLGTDSTRVYLKGQGIVIDEPSIVAFNNRTNRIIAVGFEAKRMMARTPTHITAIRPFVHGAVGDFDMAREMLQKLLQNKNLPWSWVTEVALSVPTNLTEVERKSFEDLARESGAGKVYLVEQPLLAALGSGLNIYQPTAYLLIDIGAGTTDMAVVSMNGIVVSRRLKIAGIHFDNEVIKAVRDELKLHIGEPTAEEIKIAVGSATPQDERYEITVRGRDAASGLPKEITIKDIQVRVWLLRSLRSIVESAKDLIESTPPELAGDVHKNGVYLCGGGSLLRGIDKLLEREIGVRVRVSDDAIRCVARGAGMIADDLKIHQPILNTSVSLGFGKQV
ncbi:MAG: rod shape-determining protein [Nanoarchaeota archaeon]|nr:rod shape-determining protein [Nanoarchaeota archaeon]